MMITLRNTCVLKQEAIGVVVNLQAFVELSPLKKDSTFLVFAYSDSPNSRIYWTNDCSLTNLLSSRKSFYNRLGKPLKHIHNQKFHICISKEEALIDSISQELNSTQQQFKSIQAKNKSSKTYLIILSILLIISSSILLGYIHKLKKHSRDEI